ncbi:hypothetical protein MRX96_041217 [Rhipicephalus microplus]
MLRTCVLLALAGSALAGYIGRGYGLGYGISHFGVQHGIGYSGLTGFAHSIGYAPVIASGYSLIPALPVTVPVATYAAAPVVAAAPAVTRVGRHPCRSNCHRFGYRSTSRSHWSRYSDQGGRDISRRTTCSCSCHSSCCSRPSGSSSPPHCPSCHHRHTRCTKLWLRHWCPRIRCRKPRLWSWTRRVWPELRLRSWHVLGLQRPSQEEEIVYLRSSCKYFHLAEDLRAAMALS